MPETPGGVGLYNLLYTNANPCPETICIMCEPWIGMVFDPEYALPLPAHPGCYCTYFPTDKPVTEWEWADMPTATRWRWVLYVAWMLRTAALVPELLRSLIPDAEEYNEGRDDEQGPAPPGVKPPERESESVMSDGLTTDAPPAPRRADTNPVRLAVPGRLTLAPLNQSGPTSGGIGRREYDCAFMQPGRVKQADQKESQWLIPASVIEASAGLFDARPVYLDHPELFGFGFRQEPRVSNLVGVTFGPRWSEEDQAMVGGLRLYDQEPGSPGALVGALMDQILADKARGLEVPPVGLSAVVWQESELDEESGLRVSTAFHYVESVDVVYDPGAGGYIRAALSAIQAPPQVGQVPTPRGRGVTLSPTSGGVGVVGGNMPDEIRTEKGGDNGASSPIGVEESVRVVMEIAARLEERWNALEPDPVPAPAPAPASDPVNQRVEDLGVAVDRLAGLVADQEKTIIGMGDAPRGALRLGRTGLEQVEAAFDAMLDGVRPPDGIQPLTGIRETYHILSGDFDMRGVFDADQVYLANVTASTMAGLVANRLNKRVMIEFAEYPQWWRPIVTPEDFTSLQDVRWITLGGVGELPTVSAGAAYTELTWDDLTQIDSFVKKGGYLGLTIEAIDKDETRKLRSAPRALAQAAWLTLSKAISEIFTSNSGVGPNIYYDDSSQRALFHTSNGNLGTTALSAAAWEATRIAMRKQTEHHSGERLGALVAPRFCLVPPDLEFAAIQVLATAQVPESADWNINPEAAGDGREARLAAARKRVIVVDLWTDANNWAAVADPRLYPSIGLGFRYGRTPEVVSVADPRAGLMFTNDVMPIKVRFFFATGPIDHRGMHKHNV